MENISRVLLTESQKKLMAFHDSFRLIAMIESGMELECLYDSFDQTFSVHDAGNSAFSGAYYDQYAFLELYPLFSPNTCSLNRLYIKKAFAFNKWINSSYRS